MRRAVGPGTRCEGFGHIDSCSRDNFRHTFYPYVIEPGETTYPHRQKLTLDDVMLVDEILGQSVSNNLTVVSQLQLALRVASAVLMFNSTPWMSDIWGPRDLSFFHHGQDLTASLQTLHFRVELIHEGGSQQQGPSPDTISHDNLSGQLEDAQYKYGVRNVSLYSLGVVLLAIGRWARVDQSNVEAVRRLASQSCPLGPRYQELTQKVIDCDFGYGKDLAKPKLQEAVYENVLMELESMIASLDIGG